MNMNTRVTIDFDALKPEERRLYVLLAEYVQHFIDRNQTEHFTHRPWEATEAALKEILTLYFGSSTCAR